MFSPSKKQFEAIAAIILLVVIALALLLSSCNVTRTVTTTAQTIQRAQTFSKFCAAIYGFLCNFGAENEEASIIDTHSDLQ